MTLECGHRLADGRLMVESEMRKVWTRMQANRTLAGIAERDVPEGRAALIYEQRMFGKEDHLRSLIRIRKALRGRG